MVFFKRTVVAVFLALVALAPVPGAVTPAYAATTPQEVLDLIDIRIAQLTVIQADQQAIALDTNQPISVRIEAQAQAQQAFIRILQLTSLKAQVPFFPMAVLDALANQLQAIISAA